MERTCFLIHEDGDGVEHELKVVYLPLQKQNVEDGISYLEHLNIEIVSITENEAPVIFKLSDVEQIKNACREHFSDDDWEYAD